MITPPAGATVGIDVEDIDRWRSPQRKIGLIFTPDELAYAGRRADPAPTFAGLWCAREAAFKALSPHVAGLGLRDLAVGHDADGRPVLVIANPRFAAWAQRVQLSIAHSASTATAIALCQP